jgi:Subtilase family
VVNARTCSWPTAGARQRCAPESGGPLPSGPHVLVISELLSEAGERLADRVEVPFLVSDTRIDLPSDLRVESMVRLVIGELRATRVPVDDRPDGPFIELFKAAHRKTGDPLDIACDQDGRRIDAYEAFASVARNREARFGKLQQELHEHLERSPREPVTVAVWIRTDAPATRAEKSPRRPALEPASEEREQDKEARRLTARLAAVVESELAGEAQIPDSDAPLVIATLAAEQVRGLAGRDDVAAVFLHATDSVLDLGNSMAIANSDDVQALGFEGAGIDVAVWEDGPDQVNLLPIVDTFAPTFNGNSKHARHTHGIVANTEARKPHGHAAGCSLHSANRNGIDALRWAVREKGCTVVSQSFHRSSEPGSADLQSDDVYKDWLALRWPYPTIVQAAGNYWNGDPDNIMPPSDEYVNHKTFNCLTVGNRDDAATAMSGDSVFRNPASRHGDRELPEIAANGTSVTAVGLTMSGTSMAAPAAAGCVALIQDANATLRSWPEGCRAIMMAGATRNSAGSNWWTDVAQGNDASDGAGAVDALESLRITQSRRTRNAPATRRGWDVGTLRSADIGHRRQTTFSYLLQAPAHVFGATARVALAWDSNVAALRLFGLDVPLSSTLSVDLDLQIYDSSGNQVGYSGSFDNSYEIAEFAAQAGSQYTIKIRRWSGTDDVWYGIAWTLTGELFVLPWVER